MENVFLTTKQRSELNKISKSRNAAQKLVQRSEIILLAAEGHCPASIAKTSGVHRTTATRWVNRWLSCFQSEIPAAQILNDSQRTGAPSLFAPDQICQLFAMACEKPSAYARPISHWSPRELADEMIKQGFVESISARQVGRLLGEADIKPHLMRYYLHSEKDEDFDKKTEDICGIYQSAPAITEAGGRVISCDEMCGIQALERAAPDKPAGPGATERHEFNYIRHGTTTLIASFDVGSGKLVLPTLGPTRTEADFANHIRKLMATSPSVREWHFVLDNLNTHQSEALVNLVADRMGISKTSLGEKGKDGILKSKKSRQEFLSNPDHEVVFHYTPKHASWMNQVEIWFSIIVRKLLKRESFVSVEDLQKKILDFIKYFNKTMAKPFKWTYKGRVLSA
jgi:transposase